ncbi:hypothetical protein JCM16303_003401 [Sporobolomyces ruberrimus]
MVLQNQHKKLASKQYKKAHGIPTSSGPSTGSNGTPDRPRETGQERALRLGSNADRYRESDDEGDENGLTGDPDEVDEELLAQKRAEAEELQDFLSKQQTKLSSQTIPSTNEEGDEDDQDVDASFAHLRVSDSKKKGKVVVRDSNDDFKGLEGEARRAQAVRDLKDRFSIPSPPPSLSSSNSSTKPSKSTTSSSSRPPRLADLRRPPPPPSAGKDVGGSLGGTKEGTRGGEDFLDSLL